jgi:hypothetical protein
MKIRISAVLLVAALAAPVFAADAPAVEATIVQLNPSPEMFTFRGPVTVSYQVTIRNPLPDRTITLTRISLRTQGRAERTRSRPLPLLKEEVKPQPAAAQQRRPAADRRTV